MSSEEIHELQEHAEHAKHDPTLAPVSVTMAVLAVLVAVVSLMGHRAHTEEVVLQNKSSDQWSYYQAKNIRRHSDEILTDLAALNPSANPEALAKFHEKYASEAERYKNEQDEIEKTAKDLEDEVHTEQKRANRFDLGEVFLEVGLVITSITILSGRRMFWYLGMLMGVIGTVVAVTGFLVA